MEKQLYEITILKTDFYTRGDKNYEKELCLNYTKYKHIIELTENDYKTIKEEHKIHYEKLGNCNNPYSSLENVNNEEDEPLETLYQYIVNTYYPVVDIKKYKVNSPLTERFLTWINQNTTEEKGSFIRYKDIYNRFMETEKDFISMLHFKVEIENTDFYKKHFKLRKGINKKDYRSIFLDISFI